jgi:hypothetical protein
MRNASTITSDFPVAPTVAAHGEVVVSSWIERPTTRNRGGRPDAQSNPEHQHSRSRHVQSLSPVAARAARTANQTLSQDPLAEKQMGGHA